MEEEYELSGSFLFMNCQACPDLALAYSLSQERNEILTQQKAEELSDWFRRVKQS